MGPILKICVLLGVFSVAVLANPLNGENNLQTAPKMSDKILKDISLDYMNQPEDETTTLAPSGNDTTTSAPGGASSSTAIPIILYFCALIPFIVKMC